MDRGAWRAKAHGLTTSQIQLSDFHTHTHTHTHTHKHTHTAPSTSKQAALRSLEHTASATYGSVHQWAWDLIPCIREQALEFISLGPFNQRLQNPGLPSSGQAVIPEPGEFQPHVLVSGRQCQFCYSLVACHGRVHLT